MGFLSELKKAGMSGGDALRGIRRGTRPVVGFGDIETDDSDDGVSIGRNGDPPTYNSVGPAFIATSEYSGPYYRIEWATIVRGKDGSSDNLGSADAIPPDIVLNLPEVKIGTGGKIGGTHSLKTGTPVWVFAVEDTDGNEAFVTFVYPAPDASSDKIAKVKTYTAGSNTVVLTRCKTDGTVENDPATGMPYPDVTAKITLPAARTTCSIVSLSVGDILTYTTATDSDGNVLTYLATVPLPTSTTQYDVLSIQNANSLSGFDSVRFKT